MNTPEINVQIIRSNMQYVFEELDGLELPSFDDDVKENYALAVSIITLMKRLMLDEEKIDYIPTASSFVATVNFPDIDCINADLPELEESTIDEYIEAITKPIGQVALRIQQTEEQYKDAYLILTMLYFSLFLISTLIPTAEARKKIVSFLQQ